MPRLTVIMPAYNAASTITAAVKSTLRAMPRDSQLLVADDASTDRTVEVLSALHDPRLEIIRNDRNEGVSRTLNRLVERSDSELVARMDADDICLPWRFSVEIATLERGADGVFAPVIVFGRGRLRPQRLGSISAEVVPFLLLRTNPLVHSTFVGKRSLFAQHGGYREVPSEDYDLWMRSVSQGSRLTRIARPTLLYRKHSAQVTSRQDWRRAANMSVETANSYRSLSEMLLGSAPVTYQDIRSRQEAEKSQLLGEHIREAISVRLDEREARQATRLLARLGVPFGERSH